MKNTLRRFASLALAASLSLSALAVSMVAPSPVAAAQNNCSNATVTNIWSGRNFTHPSGSIGVKSVIDPSPRFGPCLNSPATDPSNGPSAWVALQDNLVNGNAILQIGVVTCNDILYAACTGSPRFFWAEGGCNGYDPHPQDLGPADLSSHVYEILKSPSGTQWEIIIDGVQVGPVVYVNNAAINCWDTRTDYQVAWYGERWDGGDSFGISLGTIFSSMAYYNASRAWALISINGCTSQGNTGSNPAHCDVELANHHQMYVYSDQDAP